MSFNESITSLILPTLDPIQRRIASLGIRSYIDFQLGRRTPVHRKIAYVRFGVGDGAGNYEPGALRPFHFVEFKGDTIARKVEFSHVRPIHLSPASDDGEFVDVAEIDKERVFRHARILFGYYGMELDN